MIREKIVYFESGDLIHAVCSPIDPFNLQTHLHGFFLVYK